MLLFKPYHKEMILSGAKVQTRRIWPKSDKPRCKAGSVHQARTRLFGEPFALLRILSVTRGKLTDMTKQDVAEEGYPDWSVSQFIEKFAEINRIDVLMAVKLNVWAVKFERQGGILLSQKEHDAIYGRVVGVKPIESRTGVQQAAETRCACLEQPCPWPSRYHERCPHCGKLQSPLCGGPGYRLVDTTSGKVIAEGTAEKNRVCNAAGCGMPYSIAEMTR